MRKIVLISFLSLVLLKVSMATGIDTNKIMPMQLSFITPIGTNGIDAPDYTNNMSINILAGYNGGLDGIEIGGVLNVLENDMRGIQFAGVGNAVVGDINGIQFAGTFNFGASETSGMQIAGVSNFNYKSNDLIQIAGTNNMAFDTLRGMQISSTNNFAMGMNDGFQLSGVSNINIGSAKGAQISGVVNLSTDTFKGFQLAGVSNLNAGLTKGAQVSGVLNVTNDLDGIQFGLINIADSLVSGAPIGLISFVAKNGYHKLELFSSPSMHFGMSYKTGVNKIYNIFSVGSRNYNEDFVWAFGYGLGTLLPINEKLNMNIDLVSYHLNHNEYFTLESNSFNRLSISLAYKFHKYFTVFAGASANLHVYRTEDWQGFPVEETPAPLKGIEFGTNKTNMNLYPGFNFGIRI